MMSCGKVRAIPFFYSGKVRAVPFIYSCPVYLFRRVPQATVLRDLCLSAAGKARVCEYADPWHSAFSALDAF